MLYGTMKVAIGGPLKLAFRPWVEGLENVPAEGPAILASNHLSFSDSFFLPAVLDRKVTFIAKAEYFTTPGVKGRMTAAFFKGVGQLPVDRSGARGAGEAAIRSGIEVLERGELFGIYPEGTRSPDGRLYRGKPGGLARVALATGAPVLPVAMIDTEKIQPPGQVVPKLMRPGIRIGKPLDFTRYQGMEHDRFVLRAVTDEVMYEIMKLSGQEYVDMYATAMKRQLAEAAKAEKEAEKAEREAEKAHRAAVARADKEQAEKLRAAMEQADRKETGDRPSGSRARHAPGEWGNMARRDTVMRMSVEQPLWRALTGYRVLTMIYAIGLFASAHDEFTRPWLAVAYFAVLGAWTLATLPRVASAAACTKPFLAADLTVALTGILLTPVADAAERVHDGGPTLPSIWTAGSVLAFAIKGGWRWAALASTLVAVANLVERGNPARDTVHNVVLVWVASIAIGYVVEVARASERTLARALEIEAATRERERLARDIHDGVLQVLAMVQRRGAVIGGEAAELGRMAGEQEVALRTLVSGGLVPASRASEDAAQGAVVRTVEEDGPGDGGPGDGGPVDLRSLLAPHAGSRVSLAEPGAPVLLVPGPRARWPPPSAPPWTTSAGTPGSRPAPGSWSRTNRTR